MRLYWPLLSTLAVLATALAFLAPIGEPAVELASQEEHDDREGLVTGTAFSLDEASVDAPQPALMEEGLTSVVGDDGGADGAMEVDFGESAPEKVSESTIEPLDPSTIDPVEQGPSSDPDPDAPRSLQVIDLAVDLGDPVMVVLHPTTNGAYLLLDHDGTVRLYGPESGVDAPTLLDLREKTRAAGESGAHALAFHPRDATRAFLVYNDLEGALLLSELRFDPLVDFFDAASERVLLRAPPAYGAHNGGALVFGPDGFLYLSVGDGGSQDDPDGKAQDLAQLHGKILRIDVDRVRGAYGIPSDNPFPSSEVWLYGFRNPWRMTFDNATGDLWIADVGGSIAEEIDRHAVTDAPGRNFGWPIWEGSTKRRSDGVADVVAPIHEYPPTSGRCAITGGVFYRHDTLLPLKDAYLYSDFCDGKLRAFEQMGDGWATREVIDLGRLVVHIAEDRDHTLLVLRYGGILSRVVYA